MAFLFAFLILYFVSGTVAAPHAALIHPRNNMSITPGIIIDVKDQNGLDVTSSIQIMVYQESNGVAPDGLSNRGMFSRPMINCNESTFLTSFCTPENGIPQSLQRYTIVCQHHFQYFDIYGRITGSGTAAQPYTGYCRLDEVCLNGLGPGGARTQGRQWANCVTKQAFDDTMYGKDSKAMQSTQAAIDGLKGSAYMVMSDSDGSTPKEADALDIMSWVDEYFDKDGNPKKAHSKESKCQDCMKLDTDRMAPNTTALKAQATLLSTGAAAGTLMLWLSIMSG